MEKYKIKIVKKYNFTLNGIDREDIEEKVETILRKNVLSLLDKYDESKTIVNIKKIRKDVDNNEKNS